MNKFIQIYRHSTTSLYHIFDIEHGTVEPVKVSGNQEYLLAAIWAPVGNSLAFVYNYDVYYKKNPLTDEIQITTDGKSQIRNGVCDWVYEEEVFSTKEALWFSPDASEIAFIKFDDTLVPKINIPIYGKPGDIDDQYPGELIVDYPKVCVYEFKFKKNSIYNFSFWQSGATNPTVLLHRVAVKDLQSSNDVKLFSYPDPNENDLDESRPIIVAVTWKNANTHIEIRTNRIQTKATTNVCSSTSSCLSVS